MKKKTKKSEMSGPAELVELLDSGKLQRRHIRYKLFLIKWDKPLEQIDQELKEYIESQFKKNHTWNDFTIEWDVGVNDPLKVISLEEWTTSGGAFDSMGRRIPPAFTQQK